MTWGNIVLNIMMKIKNLLAKMVEGNLRPCLISGMQNSSSISSSMAITNGASKSQSSAYSDGRSWRCQFVAFTVGTLNSCCFLSDWPLSVATGSTHASLRINEGRPLPLRTEEQFIRFFPIFNYEYVKNLPPYISGYFRKLENLLPMERIDCKDKICRYISQPESDEVTKAQKHYIKALLKELTISILSTTVL